MYASRVALARAIEQENTQEPAVVVGVDPFLVLQNRFRLLLEDSLIELNDPRPSASIKPVLKQAKVRESRPRGHLKDTSYG